MKEVLVPEMQESPKECGDSLKLEEPSIESEDSAKQVSIAIATQTKKRTFLKTFLFINLILISNVIIYNILESQHSVAFEKYQLAEAQNQALRMEINTLRKIVFLMNADDQVSITPNEYFERPPDSEDVRIVDNDQKKFICVDVKRFVDML